MDTWREELHKILSFLLYFWPRLHLSQISELLRLTLFVFSFFGFKNCISLLQAGNVRIKEFGRSAEMQESCHNNTELVGLLDWFIGSQATLLESLWNEEIVFLSSDHALEFNGTAFCG